MIYLFASFIVSLITIIVFIKYGYSKAPSSRCVHGDLTPTSGGISIVLGCVVGCFIVNHDLSYLPLQTWYFYALASSILCVTGWLDDRFDVSYRFRLLMQLICALVVMSSGIVLMTTWPQDLWWQKFITVFILVSLINAANFIDGIHGLLCLSTLVCLSNQFFLCPLFSSFILILIVSSLPFLYFNFPKGRIFIGDAGSTFFGLTLGFIALANPLCAPDSPGQVIVHKGFVLSLMPMAFLWFDVGFTLLQRFLRKQRLAQAHREHFFHILYTAGWSHKKITSFYVSTVIGMSGLVWLCHVQLISFSFLLSVYCIAQIIFFQYVWRLRAFA